jgi:hypothetical protein
MAGETQSQSQTQARAAAALEEGAQLFQQGMTTGKVWAEKATRGLERWAEKSPEQVVLAGLAVGFVLGKILLADRER